MFALTKFSKVFSGLQVLGKFAFTELVVSRLNESTKLVRQQNKCAVLHDNDEMYRFKQNILKWVADGRVANTPASH